MSGVHVEGAGNRFVLLDRLDDGAAPVPDVAATCRSERVDGLLLVERDDAGRPRMIVRNADGSRPEACGNGLRCVAAWLAREGHVAAGGFEVATDAGVRRARVAGEHVEVSMGRARLEREVVLQPQDGASVEGTAVNVGNPHVVLLRERLTDDEVLGWGPRFERDPQFPAGANVEFVVPAGPSVLEARVWERGVGETQACGSGACAIATWAVARGLADWPVRVRLPGGVLTVRRDADGELWLAGPVRFTQE